jgi:hypothetical protein
VLDRAATVCDQSQREGRLVLKVFAALAAHDDPAPLLGEVGVMLQQHRLTHAAKACQPDVARKVRETGQVLVKSPEL